MALTPTNNYGSLNGTTSVDLVAAPASSTRRVIRSVHICNVDTVSHVITVRLTNSGTHYPLYKATLAANETLLIGGYQETVVLDATTESLTAITDATATTTEPTFQASFIAES